MSEKCQFCKKVVGSDDVEFKGKPCHSECIPTTVLSSPSEMAAKRGVPIGLAKAHLSAIAIRLQIKSTKGVLKDLNEQLEEAEAAESRAWVEICDPQESLL